MLRSSCSRSHGHSRRSRRVIASSSSSASRSRSSPACGMKTRVAGWRRGLLPPCGAPPCWALLAAVRRRARCRRRAAPPGAGCAAPGCGAPPSASGAWLTGAPPPMPNCPPAPRAARRRSRCRCRCHRQGVAAGPVERGRRGAGRARHRRLLAGRQRRRGVRDLFTAVAAVRDRVVVRAVGAGAPVVAEGLGELVELLLLVL